MKILILLPLIFGNPDINLLGKSGDIKKTLLDSNGTKYEKVTILTGNKSGLNKIVFTYKSGEIVGIVIDGIEYPVNNFNYNKLEDEVTFNREMEEYEKGIN